MVIYMHFLDAANVPSTVQNLQNLIGQICSLFLKCKGQILVSFYDLGKLHMELGNSSVQDVDLIV